MKEYVGELKDLKGDHLQLAGNERCERTKAVWVGLFDWIYALHDIVSKRDGRK